MSEQNTLGDFADNQGETDEWQPVQLGDETYFTRYSGDTPVKSNEDYWSGEILWLSNSEISDKSINTVDETDEQITKEGLENCTAQLVPENSVILSCTASIGKVAINSREMATNQQFNSFEVKRGFNSYYLANQLLSMKEELETLGGSTTHNHLSVYLLDKVEVDKPSLSEQRKIATVLYNTDRAIEKTEETISQLGRVKKGLYQTLFSEGYQNHDQFKSTKYGEVPENWRVMKLAEITSQIQAGGTPDTDEPEYYGGDIPWVKTGELSQYRVTETEQNITEKGFQESTARLFSPGTILIAMYGATTGEVSLLDIEATTNQACCGVVTTAEMKPEFLFHQLNYLSNHLESLSAGSGQQNISKGIIEKFDVLVPTVEEQSSIVRVLNSVDESISENKSTKKQYQRLKQGLMQDLLSGTIRTTDTNIEVLDEIVQHG